MAEIGVVLLMFGVGLHFHPHELLRVWRVAVPGAIGQSVIATLAGWACARTFGWSDSAGLVFGMALAVASTVVLMRMLGERGRLATRDGHVAVGWLIVEDLFTVLALVVLPALVDTQSGPSETAAAVLMAIGKAALFTLLVWGVGSRAASALIERMARTRSSELFTLAIFVVALGVAVVAAEVFHVSVALGAFFAGLVVARSRFGAQAAADMAPFRDVFSALFFVSVGMLFNPAFVVAQPLLAVATVAVVLLVKPMAALLIVLVLRHSVRTGLTVAVGLGQIGEFSFVLAALGKSLGILPAAGFDALVCAAIVSIGVNPLLFRWLERIEHRLKQPEVTAERDVSPPDRPPAASVVVLAGISEMSRRFLDRTHQHGMEVCVVEPRLEQIELLRSEGVQAVFGDAARGEVLQAAGVEQARVLVVAVGSLAEKMQICMAARRVNPRIEIIATAESSAEHGWLQEFGAAHIHDVMDETADALFRLVRGSL